MRSFQLVVISLSACLSTILFPLSVCGQPMGSDNYGSGTVDDPYNVPKTEIEITVDAVLDEAAS